MFNYYMCVWDHSVPHLHPFYQFLNDFFCTPIITELLYRKIFVKFSMMVLYFSCYFDAVVGGFQYYTYLCHHLDQKLSFFFKAE